ncbi:MAG: hypothetical protein HGB11_04310 [Chlorobiales bacterium]|nr:hypothetical protein [Chlorobiales bacterium]
MAREESVSGEKEKVKPEEKDSYEKEDVSVSKIALVAILGVITIGVIIFLLSQFFSLTLDDQIQQTILKP